MNNKFIEQENNEWVVYERQVTSLRGQPSSRKVKINSFTSREEAENFIKESK
jgi:hypothetical protein